MPTNSHALDELQNAANLRTPQPFIELDFRDTEPNYKTPQWLCKRTMLVPKNTDVAETDTKLFLHIPGLSCVHESVDKPYDSFEGNLVASFVFLFFNQCEIVSSVFLFYNYGKLVYAFCFFVLHRN